MRTFGPDPRFGMQAPVLKSGRFTTPGGRVLTLAGTRTVTLASPLDPFSITQLTETMQVNGRTYSGVYQAATRRLTLTTPMGRQLITTLDAQGRVIGEELVGLAPLTLAYDAQGRLDTAQQGSGQTARITSARL